MNQVRECRGCSPPEYFQALAWSLQMYRTGCCPNVDFVYRAREAPCAKHCCDYLEHVQKNQQLISVIHDDQATPLSTNAVLLLLIPRWGAQVLPEPLHQFMDHQELVHWYPPACSECDQFRAKRKLLMVEHDAKTVQIKKGDSSKKKDLLRQLTIERKEFESEYDRHVKMQHPVYPPPVDIVRRLLGKDAVGVECPFSFPVIVSQNELKRGGKKKSMAKKAPVHKRGGEVKRETIVQQEKVAMDALMTATSLLDLSATTAVASGNNNTNKNRNNTITKAREIAAARTAARLRAETITARTAARVKAVAVGRGSGGDGGAGRNRTKRKDERQQNDSSELPLQVPFFEQSPDPSELPVPIFDEQ